MKLSPFIILSLLILSVSCKSDLKEITEIEAPVAQSKIEYAEGFQIKKYKDYTLLEVTRAFPGTQDTLRYALVKNTSSLDTDGTLSKRLRNNAIDAIIQVPLKTIVVTSTTHIPSLEALNVQETLVGFPNLDYISSQKTRDLITAGGIKELGQNETINTEVTVSIHPDAVISFGVEGENAALASIKRAGIPVLYNGDWVEKNPLGKAEWIKFFGALYDKSEEANTIFAQIETEYTEAKTLAKNFTKNPTVLSGAMFKDIWYVPNGESWPAKLIEDAGGIYLWADTQGTGSISLSIESVLEKAQNADYWIAPAQYSSYSKMQSDSKAYTQFKAFKEKKIYTFATKKGETGGLLYYELAPNRPDIVLKDLIFYLHPGALKNYTPTFFTPLED